MADIKAKWASRALIDRKTYSLTLNELSSDDSGNYFCKVFDDSEDNLFNRTLSVQSKLRQSLVSNVFGADRFLFSSGQDHKVARTPDFTPSDGVKS